MNVSITVRDFNFGDKQGTHCKGNWEKKEPDSIWETIC